MLGAKLLEIERRGDDFHANQELALGQREAAGI